MNSDTVKWLSIDRDYSYFMLAIATWVVYDHITTLGDEVELVWKRPKMSVVQVLFFLNRYTGAVLQIYPAFVLVRHIVNNTEEVSDLFNALIGYLGTVVLCASQGISIYRVSSMYNHSRKIIALLLTALVLEVTSMVIIQTIANHAHAAVPEPAPDVHLCKQSSFPRWSAALWLPIICFELLGFTLVFSEGIRFYKSRKFIRETIIAGSGHSLLFILLRQSIAFTLLGIIVSIPDIVAWYRVPYLAGQMTFSFTLGTTCIISSRLILNLREAYYQPFEEEMSLRFADDLEEDEINISINDIPDFNIP